MKKKILSMFALASMLLATSCSNDEFDAVQNGKEATVTFTAQLPDGFQTKTRAFGDGTTATNLSCFVYDENWEYIPDLSKENLATMTGLKTNVALRLVNGEIYNVVFWADADDAPYTFSPENGTVSMNYGDAPANAENRDAFLEVVTLTVNGASTQTVYLKRPFAQINIGTTDWAAVEKSTNVAIKQTGLGVATYSTLNFNGKTTADATTATFTLADMPAAAEIFPKADAGVDKYLSMNYILVGTDKEVVDVTINYDGGVQSRTFANVPVQRNWRTNIYGNLLTSENDFNVEIVPGFDDNHDYEADPKQVGTNTYEVSTADGMMQIATIIANTPHSYANPLIFKLAADIDMAGHDWTPIQCLYVNFDGQGKTISNLNCVEEDTKRSGFIRYLGGGFIKDLTFENVTSAGVQAGIIAAGVEDAVIENVTIKGVNSVSYKDYEPGKRYAGVGAIFGVDVTSKMQTYGITIAEGAIIYVDRANISPDVPEGNIYAMYTGAEITANNGKVIMCGEETDGVVYAATAGTLLDAAKDSEVKEVILAANVELDGSKGNYLTLTDDKEVTIKAAEGQTVSISGFGMTHLQLQSEFKSGNITFEGINFDLPESLPNDKWVMSSLIVGDANVTFKNCTFTGNSCPIYLNSADARVTVENCIFRNTWSGIQAEVHKNQGTFDLGINLIIRNCDFTGMEKVLTIWDWEMDMTGDDIAQYLRDNGNTFTGECKQTCDVVE